jgi:hypothetical protein
MTLHSKFGGSVAHRVMNCPRSASLVEQVPADLRKTSVYATRGTALHAAMVRLIEGLDETERLPLNHLVGKTIDDYVVTCDDVENSLAPVLAYVDALLVPGAAEFYVERRVEFPGIAGAFGTVDLLARVARVVHVIDHKFGSGVPVRALWPDGDTDVVNAQLAFYAAAARHTHPEFFAGVEDITLTILQPVSIEPDAAMASSVTITHAELDAFAVEYRRACQAALTAIIVGSARRG